MKNEIENLVVKYDNKWLGNDAQSKDSLLHEIESDLQTLLKLWGKSVEEIINENAKDKAV